MVGKFSQDGAGNVSVLVAIAGIFLIALVGGAIDAAYLIGQKSDLKSLADEASTYAARKILTDNVDHTEASIAALVSTYIAARSPDEPVNAVTTVDIENAIVSVDLDIAAKAHFPSPLKSVDKVRTHSRAQAMGELVNICVLGLSPSEPDTVDFDDSAQLDAAGCGLFSNSTSSSAFEFASSTSVTANDVCVVGGIAGSLSGLGSASLDSNCMARPTPLFGTAPLDATICTYTNKTVSGMETINPGTYCGGLIIDGGNATLTSGEYIIKDGPLRVTNGGRLHGSGTGFYFLGTNAVIDFTADSIIDLSAPMTGNLAGLLFFAPGLNSVGTPLTQSAQLAMSHQIRSNDARRLTGTILISGGRLEIGTPSAQTMADLSDFTILVAQTIEFEDNVQFKINSDYHLSSIPVPEGLGTVDTINIRLLD